MIVQSPLKQREARPNLRRVPLPDSSSPSPSSKLSAKRTTQKVTKSIKGIKPARVILATLLLGLLGFLYLTHVFATQKLLEEVQGLETQFNTARSQHDALRLQYDRMIGPADIYKKAEAAGFVNGGPADKVITIEQ